MGHDTPIPPVSPDWAEGRYFDLWMLVHGLSGVAGGFSNVYFGLTTTATLGLALLMMMAWEIGELAMGVRESWSNRFLDIAVGLLGVAAAVWVSADWGRSSRVLAFWGSFATATTLGILGGIAYRRRNTAQG